MSYISVIALCVLTTYQAAGQFKVELPPVEVYPENGRIVGEARFQYVFIDKVARELVVTIDKKVDETTIEPVANPEDPEQRLTERIPLAIDPNPELKGAFEPSEHGRYTYRYSLANGQRAIGPIVRFILSLPSLPEQEIGSPSTWSVTQFAPPEHIAAGLREANYGPSAWRVKQESRLRRDYYPTCVRWTARTPLVAGGRAEGFQIRSAQRPGLLRAFVQGINFGVSIRNPLPTFVKEFLYPFNAVENNSLSTLVIGPKFDTGTDSKTIIDDYVANMKEAIEIGMLSSQSSFYAQFVAQSADLQVSTGTKRMEIISKLTSEATSVFEQTIAEAIRASLI